MLNMWQCKKQERGAVKVEVRHPFPFPPLWDCHSVQAPTIRALMRVRVTEVERAGKRKGRKAKWDSIKRDTFSDLLQKSIHWHPFFLKTVDWLPDERRKEERAIQLGRRKVKALNSVPQPADPQQSSDFHAAGLLPIECSVKKIRLYKIFCVIKISFLTGGSLANYSGTITPAHCSKEVMRSLH